MKKRGEVTKIQRQNTKRGKGLQGVGKGKIVEREK